MGKFDDFVKRGESLFCQGKYLQAMEFFLVGAESSDVDSCYLLAKTYIELGNEFEAKKALHKILAVDPDHQQAVELLVPLMAAISGGQKKGTNTVGQSESVGVFSIDGEGHKVTFAPGNLQFQASTGTYRFAPEQYEIIGQGNENISQHYDGWIDLFGWGTGNCPYKTSDKDEDYSNFRDWCEHVPGGWRCLSGKEWEYIIANHINGMATVCGQQGWCIVPDDWKGFFNDQKEGYEDNVYDEEQWRNMESKGMLFLPLSGHRVSDVYYDELSSYLQDKALDKLFDKFYRVGEDRSSQTGGTGLGLAIAKKIDVSPIPVYGMAHRPTVYKLFFGKIIAVYGAECCRYQGHALRLVKNID